MINAGRIWQKELIEEEVLDKHKVEDFNLQRLQSKHEESTEEAAAKNEDYEGSDEEDEIRRKNAR